MNCSYNSLYPWIIMKTTCVHRLLPYETMKMSYISHRFASIAQGFVIWEQCHYPLSLCCVVLSSIVQYSLLHTLSCTASACLCNTQITPTDSQVPQTHTALTSIRVFLTLTRQSSRLTQAFTPEDYTLEMFNDFSGDTMTFFSFSLFLRGCKK